MNRYHTFIVNSRYNWCLLSITATLCVVFLSWSAFARGQSAYFSLEGDVNVPLDEYDALFDLTRAVGSGEDLRFRAYTQAGGLNSAGDVIPNSGFDAQLSLFDSANALRGQDLTSAGPDALLSWPGITVVGTPLNPNPLPADNYRLNLLAGPSGPPVGPFAVDLIGPADAIVFTGGTPINNATLTSLKFGSTGGGTATYRLAADVNNTGTLESQAGGVIEGNGANGLGFSTGAQGRKITSSSELLSSVGSLWNLRGGTGAKFAAGGSGGAIVVEGGIAVLAGDGDLRGGTQGPESSSTAGGVGGSISLSNSDVTISGAFDLSGSRFRAGGSVSVATGTAVLSGDFVQVGGVGTQQRVSGVGGSLTVSGGTVDLSGTFDLTGGRGGNAGATGGDAAQGGNVSISGGLATLTGSVTLDGGVGGNANTTGGDGGQGGTVSVSAGEFLLHGGNVSLAGGVGGSAFFPGTTGANGSVNVTGGTFSLNSGEILGRTGAASADPLTLSNASLNVSDTGLVQVLNDLTMSNGAALNVTAGGLVDATPAQAAAGVAGTSGKTLKSNGQITNTDGSIRYDGGDGGLIPPGLFSSGGIGGDGGMLTATGGGIALGGIGSMSFDGGDGGGLGACCDNYGGAGGAGGTLNLSSTTVILDAQSSLKANGGDGGGGDTFGDGIGGLGGTIQLNSGSITQNGSSVVLLNGGNAGLGSGSPGNVGGDGGTLNVLGGSYTIADTATLDLRGGLGTGGNADGAHGLINVTSGTFAMNGGEVFAGTIQHPGTGNFDFNGGRLTAETFNGVLVQDGGTLLIGGSPGTMTVSQDYTINAGSLEIELFAGGVSPTAGVDFDQLIVGAATLGGTLELVIDSGYTPSLGHMFPILTTTGGVTGAFANVNGAYLGGGLGFDVQYNANDITVEVINVLLGDFDVDGDVDGRDFLVWQRDPSIGNLTDWQTNYGMVAPLAAASTAAPEPTSLLLVFAGALCCGCRRRFSSYNIE